MSAHLQVADFSASLVTAQGLALQLRPLQTNDIETLVAVEASAHSHPWNSGLFRDCLQGRQMCVLAWAEQRLVGYFVVTAAAGESELLNITVAPGFQGRGVGSLLLQHLLLTLSAVADTVYLEVRASNQQAIGLYHAAGFSEVGIRPNYYPAARGREDAIIFALMLENPIQGSGAVIS